MKIGMRYITCCILLIFMVLSVYAQSSCHVGGVVVDEKEEGVPYASAVVCQSGRIVAGALTHYMNVGVKQKFLKGAMSVSVLLTDVFSTYKWQVESRNSIFELTNISTRKSRMLWLGLSYNFNSFKQRKAESKADSDRSLIKLGL